MTIAVLPLNAAEGAKPQLGRQISAFVGEQLRAHAEADVQSISYLTQIDQQGQTRTAFVNLSDGMLETNQLDELFQQTGVDLAMDGMLKTTGEGESAQHEVTVRFTRKENRKAEEETYTFGEGGIFTTLHTLVKRLAEKGGIELPEALAGETMEFGTDDAHAFVMFLEGFDALNYIQQSNGAVAMEFDPRPAFASLLTAIERDKDFEGAYQVLVGLARGCAQYGIGDYESVQDALTKASQLVPEDFAAFYALGELNQAVNQLPRAVDFFEKASGLNPEDPAIYNRLGNAQMLLGMPVNAERNFRKAIELEGDDKPSLDFLAGVLQNTGRGHEIPALWKERIEADPQNAEARVKYALSYLNDNSLDQGEKAFEEAIETLEDNTIAKRAYAPYLAQKGELDRAMDFYEDVLDVAPTDVPLNLEYAQVLSAADRSFEIPEVLKRVLALNIDPNTRAQTQANLIELEQPKRAEAVEAAREKMQNGDFEGAIRDLKPMRNWLADYWKLWALLSSCQNRTGQFADAEESAKRLLEMFPGCEPAYGEYREALNGQGRNDEA
ncbi:tetratricopeptide repeat protein, partial [bacterium]